MTFLKINCLMYEKGGNMKECKFTYEVEAELEPQKSAGQGFLETADYNVAKTLNKEFSLDYETVRRIC